MPEQGPNPYSATEKQGASLLHKKDSRLQTSRPVEHEQARRARAKAHAKQAGHEAPPNIETSQKPAVRISNWLEVLEKTHLGRGASPERQARQAQVLERIKDSYHKLFVIKPQDIPESVFANEVRQAREQGHGNIPPYAEYKAAKTEEWTSAQEASLDRWVDYLTSADADAAGYPMWARYWAFMGITKMGKVEKHQHSDGTVTVDFARRDKTTVAPFPPLNSKALAQSIEAMSHQLTQQGLPKAERTTHNTSRILSDPEYASLLSEGNFSKIYAQFLAESPQNSLERLKETRGEWVRYPHGSDATELFESLQDHTLEWCTAGALNTAQDQLDGGDFYVYYSLDEYGNPTIPRIAIRKQGNDIAEIRGIEHDQHLDPYIDEVLSAKLRNQAEFPNAQEYLQGSEDMARITHIEKLLGARYDDVEAKFLGYDNPSATLSDEDLRFLYQLDRKIVSLGYGDDPRIKQIQQARDIRADLVELLNVKPTQISLSRDEALSGDITYHYGDLNLSGLTSAEGLSLPQSVGGDLNLRSLTSAEGLNLPQSVSGYLDLRSLTSAEGLSLPQSVGGNLYLGGLTSAEGLNLPQSVGGNLYLGSLTNAEKNKLRQQRPDLADQIV